MITCILVDGKPTDVRDIGGPMNMTAPDFGQMLAFAVAKERRLYVPSKTANIVASHWVDDGSSATEVVDSVKSEADLAAEAAARAAEHDAAVAAMKSFQGELDNAQLITKGLALTILDELNQINTTIRDFYAAVRAATSLADLKTRVAALSKIPDRTAAQLKAAVKAKVEGLHD
jgi:hypothetical protein